MSGVSSDQACSPANSVSFRDYPIFPPANFRVALDCRQRRLWSIGNEFLQFMLIFFNGLKEINAALFSARWSNRPAAISACASAITIGSSRLSTETSETDAMTLSKGASVFSAYAYRTPSQQQNEDAGNHAKWSVAPASTPTTRGWNRWFLWFPIAFPSQYTGSVYAAVSLFFKNSRLVWIICFSPELA